MKSNIFRVLRLTQDLKLQTGQRHMLYLAASLIMFWRKMSRVSRVPWICFRRRKIFS